MLTKKKVATEKDLAQLYTVISEIWPEVFTPIIGVQQVAYMLEHYQSVDAIQTEIARGAHYYLLLHEDEVVGYTAYENQEEKLYLSKLYIRQSLRGKGYMSQLFDWYEQLSEGKTLYLNVNQGNKLAIQVYEHRGFKRVGERYVDIGEGYVMNDYVYELSLKNNALNP
ncbi:GNAT family N-acetyltransferase [Aerococcaceae bacterium zg-BR22]|uniref:GNAT family N-acetyltransferase n=1 Tax=Aerococcaceae bacterium zg-1292 TaxID=2774330 RepID=UPI004063322E|nr:GNAT family N-acetyltransferase [Aerococcaceae bacterium zg-BR22]